MFIFMWFIECLQDFLHFTCGFIDIFSKKLFTNPHNRAYNKVQTTRKHIEAIANPTINHI